MIRIKIELVPAGVEELAQVGQEITIGCKFPLDHPERQPLFVMSGMDYSEFTYNIQAALYDPPGDGKPRYVPLVEAALQALRTKKST
jgi:hypothetical protein